MPALLRARAGRPRQLKIWSAACSSGAEVYTLAMALQDVAGAKGRFNYFILGTDISRDVLKEALSGNYPSELFAPVPEALRMRYVMVARQSRRGLARIAPELRAHARFESLALIDASYPVDTDGDIIFRRSVRIYFDKPTQQSLVSRRRRFSDLSTSCECVATASDCLFREASGSRPDPSTHVAEIGEELRQRVFAVYTMIEERDLYRRVIEEGLGAEARASSRGRLKRELARSVAFRALGKPSGVAVRFVSFPDYARQANAALRNQSSSRNPRNEARTCGFRKVMAR